MAPYLEYIKIFINSDYYSVLSQADDDVGAFLFYVLSFLAYPSILLCCIAYLSIIIKIMPPRNHKDMSDDLKLAIASLVKSGMSYHEISKKFKVSTGAISAIMKVRLLNFVGMGKSYANCFYSN